MAEEMRIVLRNYGKIDPLKSKTTSQRAATKPWKRQGMGQQALIDEVKKSTCGAAAVLASIPA